MAILSDKEIFDFDSYEARIKGLEGVTQDWAQSTVSWINRIRGASESAQKDLASLKDGLNNVSLTKDGSDKQITDYIRKIAQVGEQATIARKSEQDLTDAQKLNAQVVANLTKQLADLQQRYQSLDPKQKDYQKQQKAILSEVRTVTRSIDAQSKSLQQSKTVIDTAEDSVTLLRKQTSELKKMLDTMPGAYDKSTGALNRQNQAAVKLNDQYQKNIALLSKVEQGQRVFGRNVGNYPTGGAPVAPSVAGTALSMGRNVAGAGLALAGIDSMLQSVEKIGDVTLQFDSLDSALKVVSNDTTLFMERQAMLGQISENLGQDLSVVEKNYTNLTASSKGTRLEGQATDDIFKSVVGTMGRLKKPAEDVDRALLAVGQMMSKNTVQSEELKGQLSEVLPGAFNIAARAMGVTTSKLNDMLKNGEVMASDLLPKFAVELEKTFNPNHERRVEGLGANLARLRNEGVEWVKSINIGDKASDFIGNITRMAHSIREFFQPAVETSTARLADQTETLKQLEQQIPTLLGRYDELKSKSKLSADEQRELQTVVNSLVNLVPSAATGFDTYGNALDVNKSKVLGFAAAQRELNAELNKQAIADLNKQAEGTQDRMTQKQNQLNRGTKQQSFSGKPYFMMSAEEKRQSTDKDAGKRREVKLTDNDQRELTSGLQADNKALELNIMKRLQLGAKLTENDKKYIDESKNISLKRYKVVEGYNAKIAELDAKQADLYMRGSQKDLKQREEVLKERDAYRKKVSDLTNASSTPSTTGNDKPELSQAAINKAKAAANKAKAAAEKALRDALSLAKSDNDVLLATLNDAHQDGIMSESQFIADRYQITLEGIRKRQKLLEDAHKKESDEYKDLLADQVKAKTLFDRDMLKLQLSESKATTTKALSGLESDRSEGSVSELDYIEKKNAITVGGIRDRQRILDEAGRHESQAYKDLETEILDADQVYYKERAKAQEKAWKEQLEKTKDGLAAIDLQIKTDLEKQLGDIEEEYNKQAAVIGKKMARGKLSEPDGEKQLSDLKIKFLNDSMVATDAAYKRDESLSRALTQEKIDNLLKWKDDAVRTPKEIADVDKSVTELRRELEENLSKDKMRLANEVADHQKKTSEESGQSEIKQAKFTLEERKKLWDQTIATIETVQQASSAIINNSYQKDIDSLTTQKDREIQLVGGNADAKAKIEQDYNKRIGEVRRKQAIAERAAAVFQIGLNTAVAITDVLRTGGGAHYLDFGVSAGILSALITASGIAQIAAVLSAPMPTYKLGKKASDVYEGPAIAGEAGTELFVDREGGSQLLSKPTLINTKRGDTIYTAAQTTNLLNTWNKRRKVESIEQETRQHEASTLTLQNGRQLESQIAMQNLFLTNPALRPMTPDQFEKAFLSAWEKAPRHETHLTENGLDHIVRTGNSKHLAREKRYNIPG